MAKEEVVPRGRRDRQDLGRVEQEATPRQVGDGEGEPRRCLQDQKGLQEVGEEEEFWDRIPDDGVRKVRERTQALRIHWIPGRVAEITRLDILWNSISQDTRCSGGSLVKNRRGD